MTHSITKRLPMLLTVLVAGLASTIATADDPLTDDELRFFETRIRPVLVRECYSCHSTKVGAVKGGLWLDTREGLLMGGDSGPAVVPNDLEESLLWNAINHLDYSMPPRKKLSDEIISDFRTWIEMGAPDPRVREKTEIKSEITAEDIKAGRDFWAYRTPVAPPVPQPASQWPVTEIDHFVLEKLNEKGLAPSEDADPLTLLRRLTIQIIGLPPTPEQIQWLEDRWDTDRESALRHIVDSLLANPRFGERWGRHWLDVARYAESSGKEQNLTYPHAWRYRDYVIDSFNADKPYDQFVQEQLAGDLLPVKTDEQWTENLIATGFLAVGPKTLTEQNARQFELDLIDEQIDVTTRVMLGTSVACARCHDHKFDPIPQSDYYALSGIFRSMTTHYGTVNSFQNRRPSNLLILPVADPNPFDQKKSESELAELRSQLDQKRQEQREAFRQRQLARSGNSNAAEDDAQRFIRDSIRLSTEVGILQDQLNSYDEEGNPYSYCMGVQATDRPVNARLLERGEFDKPAHEVERGFPQVLCQDPPRIKSSSSGRLEFARWVGSDQNPLTARVMVNRIWLHMMGNALVSTPENFGATGQPPTHPELLDHLAVEFMENDWSVKQLIREIALSRVFRTSSSFNPDAFEVDPENQLIWRYQPQRLDAEVIRDAMLAVSGQLETSRPRASLVAEAGTALIRDGNLIKTDGDEFAIRNGNNNMRAMSMRERREFFEEARKRVKPIDQSTYVRSVYLPIIRDQLPRALEVFDFAEPTMVVGQRESSNTPDQGLYFLNNPVVLELADAMADRLMKEHRIVKDQLEHAFVLAYGRKPSRGEASATSDFYRAFRPTTFRRGNVPVEKQKLSAVCQAIMASAEFRYLD